MSRTFPFWWFISVGFMLGPTLTTAQSTDSLRTPPYSSSSSQSDPADSTDASDPTHSTQRGVAQRGAAQRNAAQRNAQPKFERPSKPKLIVETDQRFYYPADTRNARNRPAAVNVWGARAGLLLPAGFKAGFGYYYSKQNLRRTDLFPDAYTGSERRLQYVTGYYEPYFFRRKFWELSAPLEVGYGWSRYRLSDPGQSPRILTSTFVPVIAGLSVSGKFPAIRGLKALRWFGLNFITGYRFTAKKDFPASPVNYNGFYYSVSPVIFLDRITDDVSKWFRRRQARTQTN